MCPVLFLFLDFSSLWQNTWQKQCKEEKTYLGSWFQRFQSIVLDLLILGWGRHRTWWQEHVAEYIFTAWWKAEGEGPRTKSSSQGHMMTYFLQLGPHLKLPEPPKITPPAGNQPLNTWVFWGGHFLSKPYQFWSTIWVATVHLWPLNTSIGLEKCRKCECTLNFKDVAFVKRM
jgi:hypothetical protein